MVFEPQKARLFLNYKINNAGVKYSKVVKEGFLGEFSVERKLIYAGEFSLRDKQKFIDQKGFEFSVKDTVDYKSLQRIEHPMLEFTKGEVPDESFWDVFLEPVVAIGTIVLTVILLFSVRSK